MPAPDDDAEDRIYKWEIGPSIDRDYDFNVTDDDDRAAQILYEIAEHEIDNLLPGKSTTITIKHNKIEPKPNS